MCRLYKIHKPLVNSFPNLKRILSATNIGSYKWGNFFVSLLKLFTLNDCTVKDSFDFSKDVIQKHSKFYYGFP